jgi:hypothetical protein
MNTQTERAAKEHSSIPQEVDDEELKSLAFDESSEEEEGGIDVNRTSSSSRVNFSKLSKKEQAIRFKNMQKKIQRLQI